MKTIIIEAATEKCSVAVAEGNRLLSTVLAEAAHQHASHLTVYVQQALEAAQLSLQDIEVVALGHSPGSFTGLRVGAAVAKGFCLARPQLHFLTVDSLKALAQLLQKRAGATSNANTFFVPTINSRRGEVYAQIYGTDGLAINEVRSEILTENPFPEIGSDAHVYVGGSGANKVAELLSNDSRQFHCYSDCLATAEQLLPLVNEKIASESFEDYASYEPLYLKPPFVTKSKKKLL